MAADHVVSIPFEENGKLYLHTEIGSGEMAGVKVSLSLTLNGGIIVRVGDRQFVASASDIITSVYDQAARKETGE